MSTIDWNNDTIDPFATPTNDAPDTTPEPEPKPVNLRDTLALYALRKLAADHIYASIKDEKDAILKHLVNDAADSGATSWNVAVTDTDGETHQIAKATLPKAKPSVAVSDQDALMTWLEEHRPDLIQTIEHPATEAWTEKKIAPHLADVLLSTTRPAPNENGSRDLVTEDGELVPGVTYKTAPAPSSMTLTWGGKGSPGKELAMRLLADNAIEGRSLASVLELGE